MASVSPRINRKGAITSWRVQARDEARTVQGKSFKAEADAQRFSELVDEHGWWAASALWADGLGGQSISQPAQNQLEAVRGIVRRSKPDDWHVVRYGRAVLRDQLSLALDWSKADPADYMVVPTSVQVQRIVVTASILWGGEPIEEVALMLTGEHLVYQAVPYPFAEGLAVTPGSQHVARLVDALSGSDEFQTEFDRSGVVVRDRPPEEIAWVRIVPSSEVDQASPRGRLGPADGLT